MEGPCVVLRSFAKNFRRGAINVFYRAMLGLLFIYWIGKAFYILAERNGKNVWGYAVLGVAIYYGGLLFAAVVIAIILAIFSVSFGSYSDFLITLMAFPFGLLGGWIAYRYLEGRWEGVAKDNEEESSVR